jgi:distribution and morphology protein 34
LTADAEFYSRAQDLLTTALNKSPKPPIIVDDILVNELNLGSVPPELEILEIGDLAEDRFRGIFKMCYSGDAFLTLKTRVQVRCGAEQFPFQNLRAMAQSFASRSCYAMSIAVLDASHSSQC